MLDEFVWSTKYASQLIHAMLQMLLHNEVENPDLVNFACSRS